jgi:tyrosyl-tRNA synthetase
MLRLGGVRVNGESVKDEMRRLVMADVREGVVALQVGKKGHHHLRVG